MKGMDVLECVGLEIRTIPFNCAISAYNENRAISHLLSTAGQRTHPRF